MRLSKHPTNPPRKVSTEDLIVGDVLGHIYYYVVEWPEAWEVARDDWPGSITLVAKISAHALQICALVWSPNGQVFATGANDNYCCLFEVNKILRPQRHQGSVSPTVRKRTQSSESIGSELYDMLIQNEGRDEEAFQLLVDGTSIRTVRTSPDKVPQFGPGSETHRWIHSAAVKAIAFCPWQDGLVATGGGSNDRCIHFFHTKTGTALATIACAAQVTSLIWSTNRREIAATFGYSQPEHLFRIAVFSWPSCEMVDVVKWEKGHRALSAIAYPGGPKGLCRGRARERPAEEGGIVVASSDNTIKFHEVWQAERRVMVGGKGMLGGSDILEGLEGMYKEGDIIR